MKKIKYIIFWMGIICICLYLTILMTVLLIQYEIFTLSELLKASILLSIIGCGLIIVHIVWMVIEDKKN